MMARVLDWCYRNLLLRPWYALWEVFDALHALLAFGAGPFGARFRKPRQRYGVFVVVYAAVYLAAVFLPSEFAVVALAIGLFGVVAIGQEWARNEQKRSEIARQTRFARSERSEPPPEAGNPLPVSKALGIPARSAYPNPDSIPDLRLFAIVSALQLLILLPLLAWVLHDWRGLFSVKPEADFWNWSRFVLDKTYLKALPDWGYLSAVHEPLIDYSNPQTGDEKWAATIAWVLLYYVLVQAGFREWQIQQNLADAVTAARADPLPAILQGRRVVSRLVYRLEEDGVGKTERINILTALGRLRDRRAFEAIRTVAMDLEVPEEVRQAAAIALGQSGLADALDVLRELLKSNYPAVRKGAVIGLAEYPHPGALRFLLEKLAALRDGGRADREDPNVRGELALAVGRAAKREGNEELRQRARDLILKPAPSMLEDPYLRVCSRAGIALGLIGDPEAVGPLTHLIVTTPNPKLHLRVVPHLATVALEAKPPARAKVVRALLGILKDKKQANDDIRIAAAGGLGRLLALTHTAALLADSATAPVWEPLVREVGEVLARHLRRALRAEHTAVADALAEALGQMGPNQTNRANQIRKSYNQQNSRERVARVADSNLSVMERCKAADDLTEVDGLHAEAILLELQGNPGTPSPLKAAIGHALERMTKPKTEG